MTQHLITAGRLPEGCYILHVFFSALSVRLSVRHTGGSVENGWS